MFISIKRFAEILSFLFSDYSSLSSILNKDDEGVWKTENVSLLVANVAIALVLLLWLCIGIQITVFWFIFFSSEINSSIYIIQKFSSHS